MITRSQKKTYDFIRKYMREHQLAPTTGEIAKGIGIKSRGVVHRYLKALTKEGFLEMTPLRHRNISLTHKIPQMLGLPLVGNIAAGKPIEVIEQQETLDINEIFLGDDRYALRVNGDSMIEEGIHNGDIVVCQYADQAVDGQIVVALIDAHEATLKRIRYLDNRQIALVPANGEVRTMLYSPERVQIQGIFIGLLRVAT